jgi:hypothetical protein
MTNVVHTGSLLLIHYYYYYYSIGPTWSAAVLQPHNTLGLFRQQQTGSIVQGAIQKIW